MRPRAGHLAVAPAVLRRVVRLQHPGLRLVGLREGVAALLAHALHLPDLADRLLELLHPVIGEKEYPVSERANKKKSQKKGPGNGVSETERTGR